MKFSEKNMSIIQKHSRTVFILLAWSLVLGVIILFAIAGLAVFVKGVFWQEHRLVVSIVEFIPALMFIFGCTGGIPKYYRTWSFLLFFFINLQYYSTYSWLGAIHAAFGLVIFMISLHVAWGSSKFVVSEKKKNSVSSENSDTKMNEPSNESTNANPKMNEAS